MNPENDIIFVEGRRLAATTLICVWNVEKVQLPCYQRLHHHAKRAGHGEAKHWALPIHLRIKMDGVNTSRQRERNVNHHASTSTLDWQVNEDIVPSDPRHEHDATPTVPSNPSFSLSLPAHANMLAWIKNHTQLNTWSLITEQATLKTSTDTDGLDVLSIPAWVPLRQFSRTLRNH